MYLNPLPHHFVQLLHSCHGVLLTLSFKDQHTRDTLHVSSGEASRQNATDSSASSTLDVESALLSAFARLLA
jgi:hypothetical protein